MFLWNLKDILGLYMEAQNILNTPGVERRREPLPLRYGQEIVSARYDQGLDPDTITDCFEEAYDDHRAKFAKEQTAMFTDLNTGGNGISRDGSPGSHRSVVQSPSKRCPQIPTPAEKTNPQDVPTPDAESDAGRAGTSSVLLTPRELHSEIQ